jgi:hypothetical protein
MTEKKKDLADDLKGFEEFLDAIGGQLDKIPENIPKHSAVEHLNFLINDHFRLRKINNFLTQKLSNTKNYSQTEKLISLLNSQNIEIKTELFKFIDPENSSFHKNMTSFWDSLFKKNDSL